MTLPDIPEELPDLDYVHLLEPLPRTPPIVGLLRAAVNAAHTLSTRQEQA